MEWLNTIGLTLNIIGVVLLAIYPIDPSAPNSQGTFGLGVNLGSSKWHKEILRFYTHLSATRWGFALIGLGFVFQLISSWPK